MLVNGKSIQNDYNALPSMARLPSSAKEKAVYLLRHITQGSVLKKHPLWTF